MSCLTYELTCPIGATGGVCRWSIICCDGTEQRISLLEGEVSLPCIDISATNFNGQPVQKNSISGTTTIIDVPCTSACGTYAPSPLPTPPSPPTPPTPPSPPTPAPTPTPQYCLGAENETTIQNISGGNKFVFGGNYGTYGTNVGTYVLKNVPAAHPIAFHNFNLTNVITYTGTTAVGPKVGLDGNTYTYYYGDVTLTVTGGYGTISYECYYHGYMGGENNLIYNSNLRRGPLALPEIKNSRFR